MRNAVVPTAWQIHPVRSLVAITSTALLLLASLAFEVVIGPSPDDAVLDRIVGVVFIGFLLVGGLLVRRVPENRVSWVTLFVATVGGVWTLAAQVWFFLDDGVPPAGVVEQVASTVSGVGFFFVTAMVAGVLPALFPTGRTVSDRWRWLVPAILGGWTVAMLGVGIDWVVNGYEATQETGDPSTVGGFVSLVGLTAMVTGMVGACVSLVVRWVRSDGVERLQLRWLTVSFTFVVAGFVSEFSFGLVPDQVTNALLAVGLLTTPVTIGLAITRYRLYEVGRIVSRTVAYVVLAALVAAGYALGAVWLPTQLGTQNSLFVASTTLGILMLLNPARRWLVARLDRRFNRTPYDPDAVMERLTTELRRTTEVAAITGTWGAEVGTALEPATLAIWARP